MTSHPRLYLLIRVQMEQHDKTSKKAHDAAEFMILMLYAQKCPRHLYIYLYLRVALIILNCKFNQLDRYKWIKLHTHGEGKNN